MGIAKSCHSTYSFYIDPFFLAVPHLPISPGGLVFHVLCNDQEWTLGFGCMLQNGQDALDLQILSKFETGGASPVAQGHKRSWEVCAHLSGGSTPCESCSMHPGAPYRRDLLVVNQNQWLGQHAFLRLKRGTSGCFLSGGSCAVHQPTGGKRWETNNF